VEQGLVKLGLEEEDLKTMMKGAPEKAAIAWLIRKSTVTDNRWIASRLHMGGPSYASKLVNQVRKARRGELWKLRRKVGKQVL